MGCPILTEDGNVAMTRSVSRQIIDIDDSADYDNDNEKKYFLGPTLPQGTADFFRPSQYSQRMFQLNLSSKIGTIRVKDFVENSMRSSLVNSARGHSQASISPERATASVSPVKI